MLESVPALMAMPSVPTAQSDGPRGQLPAAVRVPLWERPGVPEPQLRGGGGVPVLGRHPELCQR